ncbi:unnamed protein product [Trichobilharzia szidati]|nr:unnamed protein product [Trichobilharzia szidati]
MSCIPMMNTQAIERCVYVLSDDGELMLSCDAGKPDMMQPGVSMHDMQQNDFPPSEAYGNDNGNEADYSSLQKQKQSRKLTADGYQPKSSQDGGYGYSRLGKRGFVRIGKRGFVRIGKRGFVRIGKRGFVRIGKRGFVRIGR